MLSIEQAKQMAAKLKSSLEMRGRKISYSAALETVSQQLGYKDWNTASAALLPSVELTAHSGPFNSSNLKN